MNHLRAYGWIVLGILISLFLPLLSLSVKDIFRPGMTAQALLPSLWRDGTRGGV